MPEENDASSKEHKGTDDSPAIHPREANEKHPHANDGNKNASQNQGVRRRSAEQSMQVWLLILNGLVFFAICYQAYVYNEQRKLMEKTLKYGERAWIGQSEISGKPQEGQPFQITVTVKNTGKTFAKRYTGVTALRMKELSQPDPDFETILREASDASTSGLIPPDGVVRMVLEVGNGVKMTEKHLEQLSNPTNVTLVFGKLRYRDIFKCDHWTIFCYRVRLDGTFELYGPYNDADENECL